MITNELLISILAGGIVLSVPILFASLGELYNQRAGVINLGIESTMILSAFMALWVTFETESFLFGTLAAMCMGGFMALLHAFTCISMRVNQLIAGMLFLTLASGLANFLYAAVVEKSGVPIIRTLEEIHLPILSDIPWLGEILFQHNAYVYLAYFLAIVFGLILYKTTWGLKIRAVGENPEACDVAGINVNRIRYLAVILSGVMAGLAGASISLGDIGLYDRNIAAGRGWIAIIVIIFARWNPYRAIVGALIFGLGYSTAANLIGAGTRIPYYLLLIMPYLVALIVIVLLSGKSKGPAALTVPYRRK